MPTKDQLGNYPNYTSFALNATEGAYDLGIPE